MTDCVWVCGVCVVWQVECIKSGAVKAREQAGAALANACANSVENQVCIHPSL